MNNNIKCISLTWLSRTSLTNLNSGEGGSNFVDIKKYDYQGKSYPYVSGQAMRFYIKEAIRRVINPEEACIPDNKGETCGQIESCILCDLFGFMTTLPDIGAITRVSPTKVAPAMGLLPFDDNSVVDFLTRRHRMQTAELKGDIVNVELGINIYRSGICIDAAKVGAEEEIFALREVGGKKKEVKAVSGLRLKEKVNPNEKTRRIRLVLDAVRRIADYSKQARLLTDFTPDILLVSVSPVYSHRLQKAFELTNGNVLNIERLENVLNEVTRKGEKVWAGIMGGILDKDNESEVRGVMAKRKIDVTIPAAALDEALKAIT